MMPGKYLLMIALTGLSLSARAQSARSDVPLMAEDLGMTKWVFQAKPSKDQVAVFRQQQVDDDKVVSAGDMITYTGGSEASQSIVFVNRNFFSNADANSWVIKTQTGMNVVYGQFVGSTCDTTGKGTFKLDVTENGKLIHRVYKYEIFLMSYAEAKKIHPDLPAIKPHSGWGYGAAAPIQ